MDLNSIKDKLSKDIESVGYHLYSLEHEKKDNIVHVFIDESLDLNQMSELSEKISAFMDKYDGDWDEYLLDVSSVGVERPIKTDEHIQKAIGSYVHIKTKELELDGTLTSFDGENITIEYLEKTRKKKITVSKGDVKKMRHAVKF